MTAMLSAPWKAQARCAAMHEEPEPRQTGFGVDISYGFSATQNDGRIQTRTDHVSGETVQYQYDQLGRLITAATQGAGGWGLAWNHDAFGNLTQQSVTKGQMTGFTLSINGATNRVNYQNYDANGNWLGMWGQSQTYDVDNRVHTASSTQHQETYLYSARNERMVSKRDQDRHRVHFYGADGLLLGIYTLEITQQNPSYTYPVRIAAQERLYFGGRLLQIGGEWVATDRLGSVVRKGTTNYKYAPYGQEIGGATANDTVKFATYTRDSVSGLDYAMNRYYKPEWGRFTSPDPYQASGGPADPGSWNRYAYVGGDPVNYNDPSGLASCNVSGFTSEGSATTIQMWCTSQSGGINSTEFVTFVGGPTSSQISLAMESFGRRVDEFERGVFLNLIASSRARVIDKMTEECARELGAKNSRDAKNRISSIRIEISTPGPLRVVTDDSGIIVSVVEGQYLAQYFPGVVGIGRRIQFNGFVNWNVPQFSFATDQRGSVVRFDILAGQMFMLGIQQLTPNQFMDLTILHEIAHSFGRDHGNDHAEYDRNIWKTCFD